jgi:hypothetical protein
MSRPRRTRVAKRRPWRYTVLLCSVWLTLAAWSSKVGSALAQPASPAVEAGTGDAPVAYDELLRQGVGAYQAEQWELARELFESAHAKQPTARTSRSLGLVALRQNRFVDAVLRLEESLISDTMPLTGELRASTARVLNEASAKLGRLSVRSGPGVRAIDVDGQPAARDHAGALLLSPGIHRLTLACEAGSHEVSVEVGPGTSRELPVEMPAGLCADSQSEEEGAAVTLHEAEPSVASTAPGPQHPASPLDSTLAKRSSDHQDPSYRRRVIGWTLLGTGMAALGAGTYFGVSALSLNNELERDCPRRRYCSSDELDLQRTSQQHAWIANGTLVAGAALTITGFVILLRTRRAKSLATARLHNVALMARYKGLVLEGHF